MSWTRSFQPSGIGSSTRTLKTTSRWWLYECSRGTGFKCLRESGRQVLIQHLFCSGWLISRRVGLVWRRVWPFGLRLSCAQGVQPGDVVGQRGQGEFVVDVV